MQNLRSWWEKSKITSLGYWYLNFYCEQKKKTKKFHQLDKRDLGIKKT